MGRKAVVAFMGERSSGKDYFCEYLQTKGWNRMSFSDELRRLAVKMFPFMEFDYPADVKDKPLIHPDNPLGLTPREIWKKVNVVREVDSAYFVKQFIKNQYANQNWYSIITDFRTPDEHRFLKEQGIPIVKIELSDRSGIVPDPFEEFVRQFKGQDGHFVHDKHGVEAFNVFWDDFCTRKGIY